MLLYQYFVIPISRLKASSANNLGDGPASFKCNREARGKPFIISSIVDQSTLPLCIFALKDTQSYNSEFIVGSMLTHINDSCICTTTEMTMNCLLSGEILSLRYVNSFEEWQIVKKGEAKLNRRVTPADSPKQMSLSKHGFFADGANINFIKRAN